MEPKRFKSQTFSLLIVKLEKLGFSAALSHNLQQNATKICETNRTGFSKRNCTLASSTSEKYKLMEEKFLMCLRFFRFALPLVTKVFEKRHK